MIENNRFWNGLIAGTIALFTIVAPARGNTDPAYSYDFIQKTSHSDWMASLPDSMSLSQLSIPGTHDTMAIGPLFQYGPLTQTQSMDLKTQLNSGIRVIDLRLQPYGDDFRIYHGPVDLNMTFGSVLLTVDTFLDAHPGETVLMELALNDYSPVIPHSTLPALPPAKKDLDTDFASVFNGDSHFWVPPSDLPNRWANPMLGSVRGKIVILQKIKLSNQYGIPISNVNINGGWEMSSITDMYDRWTKVKTQLGAVTTQPLSNFYMVALSGAMGSAMIVAPWFVASGQINSPTDSPLLATGFVQTQNALFSTNTDKYPDFPRGACANTPGASTCSIYYNGMNPMTTDYLRSLNDAGTYVRVGMVVADFPGPALIDRVIMQNVPVRRFSGNFTGLGNGILSYNPPVQTWSLGTLDAAGQLTWKNAGIPDTSHANLIFTGDFNDSGKTEVLTYATDQNWRLGVVDKDTHLLKTMWVGDNNGFGNLNDGRPFWNGNFQGTGRSEILFYNQGDGNWWLGSLNSQNRLTWTAVSNTSNLGNLADGRPMWTGNFSGTGSTQVMFYNPGDGNWFIGSITGTNMTWKSAGNTARFGSLKNDIFFVGDFSNAGSDGVMFYSVYDSHWWSGTMSPSGQLMWVQVGNTSSFGSLNDGRPFWTGSFTGTRQKEVMFYNPADNNWWLGTIDSLNNLTWTLAANTAAWGNASDGRPLILAPLTSGYKTNVLFYSDTRDYWQLGSVTGNRLFFSPAGNGGVE